MLASAQRSCGSRARIRRRRNGHAEGQFLVEDAIAGAQRDILKVELAADMQGRLALALLGMGTTWRAQVIYDDATVVRAIDNGVGSGRIASISFPSVSRSLGALVTSQGSLIPSPLRQQG